MMNRTIIDDIFASVGCAPEPVMETNAFVAALTQLASGALATIAPERLADTLAITEGVVRLRLEQPEVSKSIGLVMAEREPFPPALKAFADVIQQISL